VVYAEKRKHPGYGRDGKRLRYLSDMSVTDIERELIEDGIAGFETQLQRYVSGITEIAAKTNKPADDVHRGVIDEIATQTGSSIMPGTL